MAEAEVVYDLLGISITECAEINVYFNDEVILLEKSENVCEDCSKNFKTAFGLKLHLKSCSHQQNFEFISAEKLSSLASVVKANAISDDCLIDSFTDAVAEVSCKLKVKILAKDLLPLTETFMKNHKSEMFWKVYLGFVKNYNNFPEVEYQKYASYVLMNLGENFLATWRKDANKNRTTSTEPNQKIKKILVKSEITIFYST